MARMRSATGSSWPTPSSRPLPPSDLIRFADAWKDLGVAVTDQVLTILDNPEADDVNPAAIRLAREHLEGLHEDLDHAIGQYLDRLA